MTPRERWLALFAGQQPDRIPTDYWATDEVTSRLLQDLCCRDIEELYCKLHIDGLISINPPRIRDHHPDDAEADIWGIRKKVVNYGPGSYKEFGTHPLASARSLEDIHAFAWPTADNHDFDAYRTMIRNAPRHRIIRSGEFEPFLIYCAMRGMEQAMMDLLIEPELAMAALNHIFDYYYELNRRTYEIGQGIIDVTYIAEDLGGQTQLLLSVPIIRKFILPNQKRMADLARSHGVHIFYHTDGAARDIIPDLIDITGIELLNPIQWRCPGMEREGLVRDFRNSVIFHGAMDNQQTLPFGSADDVRAEVMDNIRIFSGARWICAPCHNIQPVTPTENIVTMYETIHQYGTLS